MDQEELCDGRRSGVGTDCARGGHAGAAVDYFAARAGGDVFPSGGGYTYTNAAVLRGRWSDGGGAAGARETGGDLRIDGELSALVKGDPARSTRERDEPPLAPLADGRWLMVLRGSNGGEAGPARAAVGGVVGRRAPHIDETGAAELCGGRDFVSPSAEYFTLHLPPLISQRARSPAHRAHRADTVFGSVASLLNSVRSVSATMKLTTTTVKVCSTEIKRFAVEGPGHGRRPRGLTGKHDRSPNCPAVMKMNPIG